MQRIKSQVTDLGSARECWGMESSVVAGRLSLDGVCGCDRGLHGLQTLTMRRENWGGCGCDSEGQAHRLAFICVVTL